MSEYAKVFRIKLTKARAEKVCVECRGKMLPGEVYERITGLWEDRWETFKTCKDCAELRGEVDADRESSWDPIAYGELEDWVVESQDRDWIRKFVETKRKRGAVVGEHLQELLEGNSNE